MLNQTLPKVLAGFIVLAISIALIRTGVRKEQQTPELQSPLPISARPEGLPLNNPPTIKVAEAFHMVDSDLVVGVVTPTGARAYPWWIMTKHQIVNDTWEGLPVIVTHCPVSSGTAAFVAQLEDMQTETTLSFRQCGIASGTFEMCDDQTLSRWHPQRGIALEGRLSGYFLPRLFTVVVDWSTWKRTYPQSEVILSSRTTVSAPQLDAQASQLGHPDWPPSYRPSDEEDRRLEPHGLVLGILPDPDHSEIALDLRRLQPELQIITWQDSSVILVPLGGRLVRAFWLGDHSAENWQWDEKTLTLKRGEQQWNLLGAPLNGQAPLKVAESYLTEWFSWVSSWPDTMIYPQPTEGK